MRRNRLISIPAGEIALRDDRKKLSWNVRILPFLLSEYPVTRQDYIAITGSPHIDHGEDRMPVVNVSWLDSVNFCNLLSEKSGLESCYIFNGDGTEVTFSREAGGYRLPTEAEWQYACQAGTAKPRYGDPDDISWYRDNSGGTLHEAGKKVPNPWGLYDMLGNAWEWCWDIYDEKEYGPYRVIRGGGWNDPARGCLATNRRRGHPTFKIDDLGFRVAMSGPT
jgi:formylglycine-generating enzyme required for sulfatase activity